jgi:hypothetical protein
LTGYIRLYRGWRESDVFGDEPMSEREAWLWLLESAAWKPVTRTNAKGERLRIERGQIHVSLRNLEKVFGWGKNKVARFIQRLGDHEMIGTASGQSGTLLTILNYGKYQDERDGRDSQSGTASGQSRDTQEEGKEGKEEKVVTRKRARTTEFEIPDWVPAEAWAAFSAMRQRKKAPVDSYIADRLLAKLEKIAASGWDIGKVLDKATLNNWTDLYMPTAGRDDDLRAVAPPTGKPADPEEFKAFCLRSAERSRQMGREQEAVDWESKARGEEPRRSGTGPPRSVGNLALPLLRQVGAHH